MMIYTQNIFISNNFYDLYGMTGKSFLRENLYVIKEVYFKGNIRYHNNVINSSIGLDLIYDELYQNIIKNNIFSIYSINFLKINCF